MKTLNLTLRTILLTLALVGTVTSALAYDFVVKGIYYNINGDEATVTYKRQYKEYTGYNGVYNGVTSIGSSAFYGCSSLKTIHLPSTVASIGTKAFYGCSSLTTLEIPESVTTIASCAFDNCCGLKNANISKSVISIGDFAFRDCTGLTDITIPNSVTTIGQYAFYYCI